MTKAGKINITVLVLTLCSVWYGCVAEGAFRVHGHIVVAGAPTPNNCRFKVVHADTQEIAEELVVGLTFQKTVVAPPGSHDYYFVVSCSGSEDFKTTTYKVTGAQQYRKPIDLGTIILKPHLKG
jgi:hypothetical protein